jgi:hypothetical protein
MTELVAPTYIRVTSDSHWFFCFFHNGDIIQKVVFGPPSYLLGMSASAASSPFASRPGTVSFGAFLPFRGKYLSNLVG